MPNLTTEFLVSLNGKAPRNLRDSIRRVKNASAGFVHSWASGQQDDAYETSQEAFESLEYIQGEILRHRDAGKLHSNWATSPFNVELQNFVGLIVNSLSPSDAAWFASLPPGSGALPPGSVQNPLPLEVALNKLKHRDIVAVNFSVVSGHELFVHTRAGMGRPDTISKINISHFCSACSAASVHI